MATMGMQAAGGNLNAKGMPFDGNGKREWSHGLFGCFESAGTCCFALFCPCVVYGQNTQRLRHLAEQGSPDPDGGSFSSGACWGHCLLNTFLGAGCVLQCMNRGEARTRYSVDGGGAGDFCASVCCGPCDLTQVAREIELEEHSYGKRS
ncbi:PLAC8 family-domain-containing protein [Mycena vulgaris]|nr:PLAC8 family-domain-containing protein [Mycena vulgaris]